MGIRGAGGPPVVADVRAAAAVPMASPEVGDAWSQVARLAGGELARRMAAAGQSGSLPLVGDGAMLLARGWSTGWARRLATAGAFVGDHPTLGVVWASGVITSEHVHALARHAHRLEVEQMAAVIEELGPWWGQLSPLAVAHFVQRVIRVLAPPPDPEPGESDAHESRSLSFALTSDSVILSGSLPRLEGEAVIAAIDAFAERLRSEADHVPASARRADGLVALVNAAHASGSIPSRGGLPVSVSVTLESTVLGDQMWTTSRGHTLTGAEQRFTACDAMITPIVLDSGHCPDTVAELLAAAGSDADTNQAGTPMIPSAAARIAELAMTLLGTRIPLAVGRTARTATPAQRRALAVRDRGCIIPGCAIPAEACQTHHVEDWAAGGHTDMPNMALLCWAHHRQRWIWGCGRSCRHLTMNRSPGRSLERHRVRRGPPTMERRGPSRGRPDHAGGCEVSVRYRTTTFTRFDHFDQPLEFFTRTAE